MSLQWWLKMFWYVLPICKGSLTSLLYIDSCWVYHVLRSLTSLLYVIHGRGSFTSPLIHCILCFMWVRVLSSLLCMYTGELTLAFLFINIYRIYTLIVDLFFTPLLMIDKKGEKDYEFIYAYLGFCIYWVYAFYNKR